MKQSEVVIGKSYLFVNTDVEHRKNMLGTVVTICGKKGGGKKLHNSHGFLSTGKKPIRFLLTNGQYANSGNLKELNHV